MHALKFRFYDAVEKKMKFFVGIWNMPDPSYIFDTIQQYTGFIDRQGKEIYEGDIVKAEKYLGFENLKAEVIFSRGRFCLNTGTIPEDLIPELCEVIGNVYQGDSHSLSKG